MNQTLGRRIRTARRHRGWTLDQLAEAAAVSRRMVVNIEQGSTNPTLGTLLKLSEALGTGLPALVEPPRRPVQLTRAGEGATLWQGEHGGRGVLVASGDRPDVVELWDWTLRPGEVHRSEPHLRGTRELLHLLEGEMVLEVDGEPHHLGPGDALAFPGDAPHSYACTGEAPAHFSLTVHEPVHDPRSEGTP
ncbi:XRE family transcriptional regulator [Nesterenkonia sp. HG001]|uniref:helix-turn-helix domain-containing protein n=1 Tax=Nesterenkonia sp. HG001 TaxID=2983207 RepID=UPI002AC44D4D|nr:XRE family transcriptional regulator [Nesterenkonia sp. HG001]MDZ5076461.1 XRE family transcriptional regulator [Nesterenkonia sp. HG001]